MSLLDRVGFINTRVVQTLASNGAVTFNAAAGSVNTVTLGANATSSTIANAEPGEQLTIQWSQDGTGSRTYVWPTACRFAANAAPTPTTTANRSDSVTFFYTGTLWIEIARAVNVPTT